MDDVRHLLLPIVLPILTSCGDQGTETPIPVEPAAPPAVDESSDAAEELARSAPRAPARAAAAEGYRARLLEAARAGWYYETGAEILPDALEELDAGLDDHMVMQADELGRGIARDYVALGFVAGPDPLAPLTVYLNQIGDRRPAPLLDVVRDAEAFDALLAREAPETTADGPSVARGEIETIADGTTPLFPAGVHDLSDLTRFWVPFPRDVTIAGEGMDRTLVVTDPFVPRSALLGFGLRDCTVMTRDGMLLRTDWPTSLALDRVRVVGFDGRALLLANRLALRARACEFLAGYGERFPSASRLFDLSSPRTLALLDGCLLDGLSVVSEGVPDGATVLYRGCRLRNMRGSLAPESYDELKDGVAFERCTLHRFDGVSAEILRKELDALFPRWRERLGD